MRPHERAKLKIWLEGPKFLLQDENNWPVQLPYLPEISEDDRNVKPVKAQMYVVQQDFGADTLIHHYSSWFALKKAVAWVNRFPTYLRYQSGKITVGDVKRGELSVHELLNAEEKVVKHVQGLFFPKELAVLLNEATQNTPNKVSRSSAKRLCNVSYSSPLRKLSPVVVDGIIRVGGRLGNTDAVSYTSKHPIILPNKHHVTDLIIRHYHQVGHVGATQVLAAIRRKFWILKGGTAVRRVISKCIKCRKLNAKPEQQIMAPLPVARITPADAPFTSVGVHYFGPIHVKLKRSRVKRYGCIFTCLTMRAIHIEVSQDLSTDSFLMAFSIFVSRRGAPTEIYSDNGTNFRGADCEVRRALET